MTAPPSRSSISGTPSRATANAGIGQLWDWLTELFAGGAATAAERAAARASLQATRALQPISASVASNALTLTLNPTSLEFRHPTLGDGTINTRTVAAAINLVISSGSTLGTTNGAQARLAVLALDNAGTVELAVVNLAGGVNLDESGVISTTAEGGAGAADSASTVYSAVARTNVPYRILGFVESTQTTAGTWASAPSLVTGGASPLGAWLAGYGQTWQALTGSRALATTYTNTSGREIEVNVETTTTAANPGLVMTVSGVEVRGYNPTTGTPGFPMFLVARIPAGATYSVSSTGQSLSYWAEKR